MTNPDLRLDEPIAGAPITAEDRAHVATLRKAQALAPGLFSVKLIGSITHTPLEQCSDWELLALSAFCRKQRDRKQGGTTDLDDLWRPA